MAARLTRVPRLPAVRCDGQEGVDVTTAVTIDVSGWTRSFPARRRSRKPMYYRILALAGIMAAFTSGARGGQSEKPQVAETVWKFAAGG